MFLMKSWLLKINGFHDGSGGYSHLDPKQVNRDRKKFNDLVLQGWVLLRFPATTVKSSPEYVSDIIYQCFKKWF